MLFLLILLNFKHELFQLHQSYFYCKFKTNLENIENILKVFTERKEKIDYVSRLVNNDEIAQNEYNLSVSSYVEAQDTREVIDIKVLNAQIKEIVEKEQALRTQIDQIVAEIDKIISEIEG